MQHKSANLLAAIPDRLTEEELQVLTQSTTARIERIVSRAQSSPPGFWYDQDWNEWVMVVEGSAALLIEGETAPRVLQRGDWIDLPAHCRHRIEWTDPANPTVWLAVHYA